MNSLIDTVTPVIPLNHIYGSTRAAYAAALAQQGMFGQSAATGELSGIVFTCAAGFFDLGHARDQIDATRYWYQTLEVADGTLSEDFYISANKDSVGTYTMVATVPETDRLAVAGAIAFEIALMHEVLTYAQYNAPGGHNSSFSPEDLPSNWMGIYLGSKAITQTNLTGVPFDDAATEALLQFLTAVGHQPLAVSQGQLAAVTPFWVDPTQSDSMYLRRRNFSANPIIPWTRSDPACTGGAALPSDFNPAQDPNAHSYFTSSYTLDDNSAAILGASTLTSDDIPTAIETIMGLAQVRYGSNYDSPTPP